MSERYSIHELREAATRDSPPLLLTDQAKLLALVEAVEAAWNYWIEPPLDPDDKVAVGLANSLSRFDFSRAENGHPKGNT